MKFSFVIPCYRSEETIEIVVKDVVETMDKLEESSYEIILVNDFSPDHVLSVIKNLVSTSPHIKGISFSKNFGQHAALMAGYREATGEYIVSLDDDGQTPITQLDRLIHKLEEGYDVVYGKYPEKKHSSFRNLGSHLNGLMLNWLLDKPKDLYVSSYFIARKFLIQEILFYANAYPYLPGLVLRSTKNIANAEVSHHDRISGESGYTLKTLIKLWLNGFTAFSIVPLRLATVIGLLCAFSGFVAGAAVVIRKLINPAIEAGYSSTMAAQFFIGGMIMLMLGMIGEYIGRIYISINNSPQYVIRETINFKEESEKDDENKNLPHAP